MPRNTPLGYRHGPVFVKAAKVWAICGYCANKILTKFNICNVPERPHKV
jgi:hypothetical protein